MSYGLGVDLGTSFVAAAIGEAGRVRMLGLSEDGVLAPAIVRVLDDGTLVSGQAAAWGPDDPAVVARDVKRRLGDPSNLVLGGRPHSAAELLAVMLADVVELATQQEGAPPGHVVLTCPAVWGPYRREHFEEVARRAGLPAFTLLTEPEAAARHERSHRPAPAGALTAVYDLGGGTFDAAVVRAGASGPELVGVPEGLEWVGGIDVDDAVVAWVDQELDGAVRALDPARADDERALRRVRAACVRAKEELSREAEVSVVALLPHQASDLTITRAEYEELIRPALEATVGALERTIASAGRGPDEILLAGGSSRIPLVRELLTSRFDVPVVSASQPKLGVALGAAALAGQIVEEAGAPATPLPAPRRRVVGATAGILAVLAAAGAGFLLGHHASTGVQADPPAVSATRSVSAPAPSVSSPPSSAAAPVSASTWYHVVNGHSHQCVTAPAGAADPVEQRPCSTSPAQQWQFTPSGPGTFQVADRADGRAWTVTGAVGDDGTTIHLRPVAAAAFQQWTVVPVPNHRYRFVVRGSGKCLDLSGDSTQAGAWIQQWYCDETPNQDYALDAL